MLSEFPPLYLISAHWSVPSCSVVSKLTAFDVAESVDLSDHVDQGHGRMEINSPFLFLLMYHNTNYKYNR